MNRRVLIAALAVVMLVPQGSASAQLVPLQDEPFWTARLRVTPFVGYLTSVVRTEEWLHAGTSPQYAQIDFELAGGGAAGLGIDIPLANRVGLSGMAAYASRGESVFTVLETEDVYRVDGANYIIGRLGLAVHLREPVSELVRRRLGASIWVGGVVMHERPKNSLGTGDFLENVTQYGANFGFSGEMPLGSDRIALQIGAEDNVIWWKETTALAYEFFGQPGQPEATAVNRDLSHVWLFRVGLSFRMR